MSSRRQKFNTIKMSFIHQKNHDSQLLDEATFITFILIRVIDWCFIFLNPTVDHFENSVLVEFWQLFERRNFD